MRHYDALQWSIDLLVLKILSRRGPLHGYAITLHIEKMSTDVLRVEEGSLYPALRRMEEAGWVHAEWATTENRRRARMYEITERGRDHLAVEEARWTRVVDAVARVLRTA